MSANINGYLDVFQVDWRVKPASGGSLDRWDDFGRVLTFLRDCTEEEFVDRLALNIAVPETFVQNAMLIKDDIWQDNDFSGQGLYRFFQGVWRVAGCPIMCPVSRMLKLLVNEDIGGCFWRVMV